MSKKKVQLTTLHYHEALDRISVLLHHGEMVGNHPVIQQDPKLKSAWELAETILAEMYQQLGAMSDRSSRIGYMDGTDFAHEVGEGNAPGGCKVYGSPEEVIEGEKHDMKECGIVKVEVFKVESVPVPKLKKKK